VLGIDRYPWALAEAAAAYKIFGIDGRTRRGELIDALPRQTGRTSLSILAAFTINELSEAPRDALLPILIERAGCGDRVLIIEPVGRSIGRWWNRWRDEFEHAGGRADEWRFRAELPAIVVKLDRAAGLDHREITGRSLWVNGANPVPVPQASN
jgi:hypothetical protein